MENVNGMIIAANTAGAYSDTSSQSISLRFLRKYVAINTKAGPVAKAGMLCANGAKIRHAKNSTATVTAVSPVFPPSLIPAPDSIYDVVFDVPINAPTVVAVESASNALSMPSTSPVFLLTLPVRFATEVNVPAVSKKSTNKNANAVPMKPAVANNEKSSEKA